jgi:DNA-binding response OmpR family regulator
MRVLLVEDHQELAETVADVLRSEGMAVGVALDGQAALERAAVNGYDVIVLDRDLPGVHGDAVCRALAAGGSPSRLLMLTAAGSVEDRVDWLELGADDYLPKPFAFTELTARIRALGRRSGPPLPAVLAWADLRLDPARRSAIRAGPGNPHRRPPAAWRTESRSELPAPRPAPGPHPHPALANGHARQSATQTPAPQRSKAGAPASPSAAREAP